MRSPFHPAHVGAPGAPCSPLPRSWLDLPFLALVLVGGAYAFGRYHTAMDVYEKAIFLAALPALIALGRFWGSLRILALAVGSASLLAIALYARVPDDFGADLSQAEHVFLLKYFLSSQSAILWMGVLIFMSTVFYWLGFVGKTDGNAAQRIGSRLAWVAVFMALVGTFVRWFESHQMAPDIGHVPVSNLYEVFVLFCWLTTLLSLYYEQHLAPRSLGAFVMLIVSAAVGFLLWYAVARGAQEIQPLVPALQSWWMKLHVPANFIGYGSFALSAMVASAYLVKRHARKAGWRISDRLPALEVLDDVMYKSIAVGFAFFTIATILGALWAAEAWGGYWSWDPKETWALIVWLNYAAWLHMRLIKGVRGGVSAWWALVGLVVTTFAFLGVNLFLSGLHSYGEL